MSKFSFAQLEGLWIQAGGDPRYASIAAAVAMAESSGDSQSLGHNPGSTDVGLWQINGPGGGDLKYLDPMTNAREAIRQSHNGIDWRPWCTAYTDGACGTKGGGYSLSNSPAGRALRAAGGSVPPSFSPAGNATPASSGPTAGLSYSYNSKTCAWGIDLGTFSTPQSFLGFPLPALQAKAGFCVLSKTQVRALLGGILVGAGTMVIFWGTGILVSFALRRTIGLQELVSVSKLLGAGKPAQKVASKTSSRVTRQPSPKPVKPPMGENNPRTEKKYRKAFESGAGE